MPKIFLSICLFIIILNEVIHTAPFGTHGNEDIMVASSRLHRGPERLYHRINSIPDIRNIPSDNLIPHYRREIVNAIPSENDEEPETFLVNMKIDSDEQSDTKYVNLYIDA